MKDKVLITGSSGFMGGHLIKLLATNNYEVLGIDHRVPQDQIRDDSFVLCDLLDIDKLQSVFAQYQPDVVVHLAARTDLDEKINLHGYATNIEGTENLTKIIADSGCVKRALFTSSQLVCRVGCIPVSDTDYQPNNLYGESKVLTEKIVRRSKMPDVTWCILRPTTIWEEGMLPHYQRFLRLVQRGRFVHIGNDSLYKSYGYIGNAMHQYLRFIEAEDNAIHGKTFYIADYEPLSLRKWEDDLSKEFCAGKVKTLPLPLARVAALVGDFLNLIGYKSFPFNSFRINNILTEYIFDLSATEEICGELSFSMNDGVVKTVEWIVKN